MNLEMDRVDWLLGDLAHREQRVLKERGFFLLRDERLIGRFRL